LWCTPTTIVEVGSSTARNGRDISSSGSGGWCRGGKAGWRLVVAVGRGDTSTVGVWGGNGRSGCSRLVSEVRRDVSWSSGVE
jgi:hypothetical protein